MEQNAIININQGKCKITKSTKRLTLNTFLFFSCFMYNF